MENIGWVLRRIKPYTPLILVSLLGSLLQSAGATSITLLVKGVVDDVFVLKHREELERLILMLLGSALVMQGGFFLSRYLVSIASERVLRDIRGEVFRKLLYVPYSFFIKHPTGDLISRTVSDVDRIRQVLVEHIPVLLREPVVGVALVGVLLYRDPILTLILLVVLPGMSLMVKYFGGKKGKHTKKAQESTAELTQVLSQTLQGIENVKVFTAEDRLLRSFEGFNGRIYRSSVRTELYVAGNTALNYILGYLVVAGVMFYGGFRIVQGSLSPGDFISYLTALFMVQPPLLNTQKALMNLRGSLPVVERIRELLSVREEEGGRAPFPGLKEEIELRDLSVEVDGKRILSGINLRIKKGEAIGIVGMTGSGKSTLLRVLARLVDYEGSLLVDGKELRDFELRSIRKKVGISTQETFLLNASIRENLKVAKSDASEEELREALRLALCDFVERFEDGLDTVVGEKGRSLSGGERQRLSLARLFLRNPDIIMLDEATSALDMDTEKKVLKNVFEFFRGKTLLIVAHRLSNVVECDRIVVMKKGKLVEVGSFEALVEKRGEFYRIFREMI